MPKVSIVGCKSYESKEVFKAVSKAVNDIGFKIRQGSKVVIKPNILMGANPKKAITTHPAVIDAICKILKKKKCKITIAESFGIMTQDSNETFKISGIKKIAEKYGANLVCLSASSLEKVINKNAGFANQMLLPKIILDANLIINVPKMKTHTLMIYTGSVKNLFGCIPGGRKQAYHSEANTPEKFANLLLDIWMNVKPKLSIMDAVIGMDGDGPSNGNPKEIGLIMASDNAIAMDIAAEKIIGFENKIPTNELARQRKLIGESKIEIIGRMPKIDFKAPGKVSSIIPGWLSGFVLKHMSAYPVIDKSKCINCLVCIKVCPVGAMQKGSEHPECDRKKCIACYCCHELCPHHAIMLKRSSFFSFVMKAYNFLVKGKRKD